MFLPDEIFIEELSLVFYPRDYVPMMLPTDEILCLGLGAVQKHTKAYRVLAVAQERK